MTNPSTDDDAESMVPCKLCSNSVWIRKDRLQKHIQKAHPATSAPKKSFTTYTARIASSLPPKIITKTPAKAGGMPKSAGKIILTARDGQRMGKGICGECGLEQPTLWHYAESNLGAVSICSNCKTVVFERSFQ